MPITPSYFWEGIVELEIQNLAFSLSYRDEGRGATRKRIFTANWLRDGQVFFNPSRRLRGWFKKNLPLIRSSYATQVDALKVFPDGDEEIPVCRATELIGSEEPPEINFELPSGLPNPKKKFIIVQEKGSIRGTTIYWYELHKPVRVRVKLYSFARALTPKIIEEALLKLGKATGLGDKYSQGYGRFSLVSFEAREERLNL